MSYAQFGYSSYSANSPHQLLSVSTGSVAAPSSSPPSPVPCSEPVVSRPSSLTSVTPPMVSPTTPPSSVAQQVAAAYESRLESRFLSSAYHHPAVHHPHHPRLAAGFYGASAAGGTTTAATGIAYAADATSSTAGYQSLTTVDASAFYPTLGGGYGMKDDPWRGSLTSAAHGANAHHQASSYYYDPTLAAYGYGGLDFNGARRKNVTRDSTTTLKAWLGEHRKNPYPTKGEKIMLAIITKMTLTQVSTWFANARRRLKKENKMTWEPRNKVESDDQHHDEKSSDTDVACRSEDCKLSKDESSKRSIRREVVEKVDGMLDSSDEGVLRSESFSRQSSGCLSRPGEEQGMCSRGLHSAETHNAGGPRLSSMSLHASYVPTSPFVSDIQLPFTSGSAQPFQPHLHDGLLGSPYQNPRLHPAEKGPISAFTPSASSSSESDSPDLMTCSALDALIKESSSASSSPSRDANSVESVGSHDDSDFSPAAQKPKIWSLAATATSKSPPPNQSQQMDNSCSHFESSQNHYSSSPQKDFRSLGGVSYGSGAPWYAAYHHSRHQLHHQFRSSGFGHYSSCAGGNGFGPVPPQTDTPPQTPPNLKVNQGYGHEAASHTNYLHHLDQSSGGVMENSMMSMCDLSHSSMEKTSVMDGGLYAGLDPSDRDSASPRLRNSDCGSSSGYGDCFHGDFQGTPNHQ